ncbi:MAG: hypothetical protein UX09_C0018G0011 [Candidatus Uhrbacteria bacterium GW2011_GWE2_45_35]|uniref:Uncharacterized protein n=2 Tax=Candidatus Uhriibacteriota TaxID=1752732 RepID=A0A0G1LS52_9BACT|nr:MAG: hypothetical protein UW63_C0010G0003 [Candidatus Uhrbacteria bacterium GW2011_GWF2_44_350]KKU08384.1 MAG: hypothetical protein UX09_C0018G0011 [Candidatus Uhrbacteria bacterium GW2011_GWE2_45_35]HBR80521.1 hypothetical protein [Candidatus Uhrbacteria bacterium]HCU31717.1 hypothetical protein [Candidatus Uhrbacteria bacterium]
MSERIKIEPTEAEIEAEARGKIRDWIHDPKLKFHFSRTPNLARIIKEGILSSSFADWAGLEPLSTDLRSRLEDNPPLSEDISIGDREKNPKPNKFSCWQRPIDWWLKFFVSNFDDYVGFLLPSNLKRTPVTPHVNESHVQVRIRPQKIEGLFVVELPDFFVKNLGAATDEFGFCHALRAVNLFFGLETKDIDKSDHDLVIYRLKHKNNLKENEPDSSETRQILFDIGQKRREVVICFLEEKIGKKIKDIAPIDCLIYFAKQRKIPLYLVDEDLSGTKVVWPPVK